MSQNVGLGMRGFLGVGEESTYAVAVARSQFFEIVSESLMKNVARIESQAIIRRGIRNTHVAAGAISVAGDIEFEATYDGWMKIAKHAFGSVLSSQPDITNAPTAYQHVFTIADTPLTGLTVEVFRDTSQFVTEPNKSHLYAGCKVSSIEFSCAVDEIMRVRAGFMGQDEVRVAKSTPSYSDARVAIYHQGVVRWNGEDIEVNNFTLSLDNGIGARPKLGSQYSREPVPQEKIVASGTFEMEFNSWTQYDDFVNTTEREFLVTFQGANLGGGIYQQIKLTCPVSLMNNVRVMMDAPGRIMLSADFKAYRTTSANEVSLTMINTTVTP